MKIEEVQKKYIAEIAKKMFGRKDNLKFLLVGRTGVGKSSTINSLIGEEVAPTGKYRPTTMEVSTFQHKHGDLIYEIIDTPGLCDDLPEVGNDEIYIKKIKEHINSVDSIWFVSRLDETRLSSDEKRGIQIITESLGKDCWKQAILIFTRADKADDFDTDLIERTNIIREEIGKYFTDAQKIPSVAVSNVSKILPNGKTWLPELFTQVYLRFSDEGALPFLKSMESDISQTKKKDEEDATKNTEEKQDKKQEEKPRINLNDEQKEIIRQSTFQRVIEGAKAGADIGADIGRNFGKVGETVGTVAGAIIGGVIGAVFSWW
ncbi:MAG: 50S ribosome-binding GTPase [Thiothrix sp.]|uniref:GTPase n=1 Tax=Thiothrix sp. TaxID=1032 RepID=UPI00262EAA40|nr:GTPase [Thiothrix sp.]MDD5394124.1 50S ribosome-binding GTPase [Thiothrix sp.]